MSSNPVSPAAAAAQTTEEDSSKRKFNPGAGTVTTVIRDSNGAEHALTVHVVLGEKKCPACQRIQATLPDGSVDIEAEIESAVASIDARAKAIRTAFAKSPKYVPPKSITADSIPPKVSS